MYNHAHENYNCPFCKVVDGIEDDSFYTKQWDIFFKNEKITAFVSSHSWPNNGGNVIIIPNKHFENLYDLPEDYLCEISKLSKKVSVAMKEIYKCDGTSVRQHNEPAGNQDVFHYHFQVLPRYVGDNLYESHGKKFFVEPIERQKYSEKLKKYFKI